MKAREIMTEDPACCTPEDTVQDAARLMVEADCGCVPVVDDPRERHLVGVVTDRDIAARAVARGSGPETRVREVMSSDPECCTPDSDVHEVERIMADRQVRRVPVVDGDGCCVGMVAQADLARAEGAVDDHQVRRIVERISEPGPRAMA
jgi:CBS domain-containing protein